jgi:hypothetical protein
MSSSPTGPRDDSEERHMGRTAFGYHEATI